MSPGDREPVEAAVSSEDAHGYIGSSHRSTYTDIRRCGFNAEERMALDVRC